MASQVSGVEGTGIDGGAAQAAAAGAEPALRLHALRRLTGGNGAHDGRLNSSAAFRVLHDLASSPSTGAAALALLHELQVYQVEVDLQAEELRRSRSELESALLRQAQLYDFAPVGCFTIDASTVLCELNLTAACMLGAEREQLLGRRLESFLPPPSALALRNMLERLCDGAPTEAAVLEVAAGAGPARRLHATANRDPDGQRFLVAFADLVVRGDSPAV